DLVEYVWKGDELLEITWLHCQLKRHQKVIQENNTIDPTAIWLGGQTAGENYDNTTSRTATAALDVSATFLLCRNAVQKDN
ncbi:hypothetical protein KIL84_012189, partial [Mauremys mutica]